MGVRVTKKGQIRLGVRVAQKDTAEAKHTIKGQIRSVVV